MPSLLLKARARLATMAKINRSTCSELIFRRPISGLRYKKFWQAGMTIQLIALRNRKKPD
jgi:hypothetical protein